MPRQGDGAERKAVPPAERSGISPEVEEWLTERSAAFARATQGRNAPGRPADGVTHGKQKGGGGP